MIIHNFSVFHISRAYFIFKLVALKREFLISFMLQLSNYGHMGSKDQSSMVASELVPIELRQGEVMVWQNELVNSPYGICPLRLSFEKETHGKIFSVIQIIREINFG